MNNLSIINSTSTIMLTACCVIIALALLGVLLFFLLKKSTPSKNSAQDYVSRLLITGDKVRELKEKLTAILRCSVFLELKSDMLLCSNGHSISQQAFDGITLASGLRMPDANPARLRFMCPLTRENVSVTGRNEGVNYLVKWINNSDDQGFTQNDMQYIKNNHNYYHTQNIKNFMLKSAIEEIEKVRLS